MDKAEPIYEELLKADFSKSKSKTTESRSVAAWLDELADAYASVMIPVQRENCLQHALALKTKLFGNQDECLSNVLNELFLLYNTQHRYAEAEPILKHRLTILDASNVYRDKLSSFGVNNSPSVNNTLVTVLLELGSVQTQLKKYVEAENSYSRLFPLSQQVLGSNNLITASTAREFAFVTYKQNKLSKAKPWAEKAIQLRKQIHNEHDLEYARDLYVLARIYEGGGNFQKSEETYRKAISEIQNVGGAENPELILPIESLANILKREGKATEAASLSKHASQLRKNNPNNLCIVALDGQ